MSRDQSAPRAPSLVKILLTLFPSSERLRLGLVLLTSILVAFFEVVGVASILPFLAILMDPTAVDRYAWLAKMLGAFGVAEASDRILALGVLTAAVIVLSNAASAIGMWSQQWYVARTKTRISVAIFDAYLAQPLEYHTKHDAPSLLKVIYNDVEALVRFVAGCLQFVARALVIVALLLVLIAQNPSVAFWTLAVLGGSYALIYKIVRARQEALGARLSHSATSRARVAQETLGGIKELMVLGRMDAARDRFAMTTEEMSKSNASNEVVSSLPRYILEPVAFGGILAVALTLLVRQGLAASAVIPTLALFAFVGYRLLPALQTLYYSAIQVRFALPPIQNLYSHWLEADAGAAKANLPSKSSSTSSINTLGALSISANSVCFRYAGAEREAIRNVSVTIEAGTTVGIVGRTGSGKTTFAELLLGLYRPTSGRIIVGSDDYESDQPGDWHLRVGYVPQHVFLSNASVAQNIAFGVETEQVDWSRVERAAEMAQAADFIRLMPDGFRTIVGERGVRLSGGQRQRLGIARALYHNPSVLVFDEATSALDGLTEDAVMKAVNSLRGERTIVLIAHRLRTVESCDRILVMDAGRVVADGTYRRLLVESPDFRALSAGSAFAVAS